MIFRKLIFGLLIPAAGFATIQTWSAGAAGNWNTPANWSGAAVPGAADTARFDGTSVQNCTVDANANVLRLEINAGYSGTVTQNSGITLTLGAGGFNQSAGTFTGGNTGISLAGLFSLSGGIFNAGSQTITSTYGIYPGNVWVFTGGTFNAQTGTVLFNSNNHTIVSPGSGAFNNVTVNICASCLFSTANPMDVNGTLTLTQLSYMEGTILAGGNVVTTDATVNNSGNKAVIYFDGTGNQTLSAGGGTGMLPAVQINKSAGTLTLQDYIKVGGAGGTHGWIQTAGAVNAGTSTVEFAANDHYSLVPGSTAFNNVVFNACSGCNVDLTGSTLDINGNLTFTVANAFNGGTMTVGGNLTSADASIGGTAATTLDGTGTQTVNVGANDIPDGTFTVNKPSGLVVLAGNLRLAGAFNITSGSFIQGSTNVVKTGGAVTIGPGGLWINTGTGADTLGGDLSNNGLIYFNGGGHLAGDADPILIRSSVAATARTWSGTGKFMLYDVNAQDQNQSGATITPYSSTNAGNSNWNYAGVFTDRFSIGTNAGVLYNTGTVSTNTTRDTLTFSASLPANVGEGDRLVLDVNASAGGPETLYVLSRVSATRAALQLPASQPYAVQDFEVKRRFNTLQGWEDARNGDLIAQGVVEKGICYSDGVFTAGVIIDGSPTISTSNATHYPWLTAAPGQRHTGRAGTGVRVDPAAVDQDIDIEDDFTVIEWMEVTGYFGSYIPGIYAGNGGCVIRNNIIHDLQNNNTGYVAGDGIWVQAASPDTIFVYNNIVYNTIFQGIGGDASTLAKVVNNTVFNPKGSWAFNFEGEGVLKNNIGYSSDSADFRSPGGVNSSNNISFDLTAPGPNSKTGAAAALFIDTTSGAQNFHLVGGTAAAEAGLALGNFNRDIDDSLRPFGSAWDIGADEYYDDGPPSNVKNLAAFVLGPTSIRLTWTPSDSADAQKVRILYRTDGTYPTAYNDPSATVWDSLANTVVSDTLNNIPDNTTYKIGLFVRDGASNWSPAAVGAQVTAVTPDGAPNNPLSFARADSSTSAVTFHHNGAASLPSDVSNVYLWVTATKSQINNTTADTLLAFTRTKAQLATDFTKIGLSDATKYYVGAWPRDAGNQWSASPAIDSIYTKVLNPLTFTFTIDAPNGVVFVNFPNSATISPNVDSVYIFYRDTGYVTNAATSPTSAFDVALSRAAFLALPSNRLTVSNLGQSAYYFSVTLVNRDGTRSMRSAIPGSFMANVSVNFTFPPNFFAPQVTYSGRDTLSFTISNCVNADTANGVDTLIQNFYVFWDSDSAKIRNNYRDSTLITPKLTLTRAQVRGCGSFGANGLASGTRYFVGIATRNSVGNWSTVVNLSSRYTLLANPLGVSAVETPAVADSGIDVTVTGLASLHPSVDSVKIFVQPGSFGTDPTVPSPKTTYSKTQLLSNPKVTIPGLYGNTKYFITVTCAANVNPNGYASIDTLAASPNWDTLRTGNYNFTPPTDIIAIQLDSLPGYTSAQFHLSGTPDVTVDSIFLYITPDSLGLASGGYKTLSPWKKFGRTNFTALQRVDTLKDGSVYFIGTAVKNIYGLWSSFATLLRVQTPFIPPTNNLSIDSLKTVGNSPLTNKITVYWRWTSGALPAQLQFLYRTFNGVTDTPTVYNDGLFSQVPVFTPSGPSGNFDIAGGLSSRTNYIVAGYVKAANGTWSLNSKWDTIRTPSATDSIPPDTALFTSTDLVLTATGLNAKNVRLNWTAANLTAAQTAEGGKLQLGYGFSTAGFSVFTDPALPYSYPNKVTSQNLATTTSAVLSNLIPNTLYYFAIAALDSNGNASLAMARSLCTLRTTVQPFVKADIRDTVKAYNRLAVDWSRALATADTNLQYVTLVVTDTGLYQGALPPPDGLNTGTVTVLTATFPIDSLRTEITSLRLDLGWYYLTVYASVGFHAFSSVGVAVDSFRYTLDPPALTALSLTQVNDSMVRVLFTPQDPTEKTIQLKTYFGMDAAAASQPLSGAGVDSLFADLTGDTFTVGQSYTGYLKLNSNIFGSNGLRGTDNHKINLRFELSDLVPYTLPDTNYYGAITIDRKGPQAVALVVDYDRLADTLRVQVKSDVAGNLSRVIYGFTSSTLSDTLAYTQTGNFLTFTLAGAESLFLRFTDSLGSGTDTVWYDFKTQHLRFFDQLNQTLSFDNGGLELQVGPQPLASSALLTSTYLWVGRIKLPTPALQTLNGNGFTDVLPYTYWFMTEVLSAPTSLYDTSGFTLTVKVDTVLYRYTDSLKFYRLYANGQMEYLGGTSSGNTLTLTQFTTPSYWIQSGTQKPLASDTFSIVVAVDRVPPTINQGESGLIFNPADTSVSLVVSVHDNTVLLDASMKAFTFSAGNQISLLDTSTAGLTGSGGLIDTTVLCTLSLTGKVKARAGDAFLNGLYSSLRVSDGSPKVFFSAPSIPFDSAKGSFANIQDPNWTLVSVTGKITDPGERDMLKLLPDFKGVYDKDRLRLYNLQGNTFAQYKANDATFAAGAGKAFLVMTHTEGAVKFKTTAGSSASLKDTRGYLVENGGVAGGWRLVSLPYKGTILKGSIVRASTWGRGGSHLPLDSLIYVLEQGSFKRKPNSYPLRSDKGYGAAFLTYLYAGDTLIVPLLDDPLYLPKAPVAKVFAQIQGDWQSEVSLSKNGRTVDNFNTFGLLSEKDYQLPDLTMPGTESRLYFREAEGAMSYATKKNDGQGKKWTLEVTGDTGRLSLSFNNLEKIPEQTLIYLEDLAGGFGVNLRETHGSYDFMKASNLSRFRVLAGDYGFMERQGLRMAPEAFVLKGNAPNPFNPSTVIRYEVPKLGEGLGKLTITLDVYNARGQLLSTLVKGPARTGYHQIRWQGRDAHNRPLASGIYFYRLTVRDRQHIYFTKTRSMLLVK